MSVRVFVTGGTGAIGGHDAVVNLATAIPPTTRFMSAKALQNNERIRTEGSAAVVDAALAAGVGRVLQESVCMFYRDQGSRCVSGGSTDRAPPTASRCSRRPATTSAWSSAGPTATSSIHLADAATAVAAALNAPAGTYNIVDDEPLTKRRYADALARVAGTTLWLRGPGRAASVFGDRLTSPTRSLRVSNARFRTATGWTPRYPSAREGWVATAEALTTA